VTFWDKIGGAGISLVVASYAYRAANGPDSTTIEHVNMYAFSIFAGLTILVAVVHLFAPASAADDAR